MNIYISHWFCNIFMYVNDIIVWYNLRDGLHSRWDDLKKWPPCETCNNIWANARRKYCTVGHFTFIIDRELRRMKLFIWVAEVEDCTFMVMVGQKDGAIVHSVYFAPQYFSATLAHNGVWSVRVQNLRLSVKLKYDHTITRYCCYV